MSIPRFITVATSFLVAILLIPAAWAPGINAADILLVAALVFACFVLVTAPAAVERIGPDHPDGQGSLDIRDADRVDHSIH
ncbi:MAG: hypothetical protein LBE05_05915 [Microbacterium sp.]|jgi:hypothetical protein|nr:hypothetical protein [Microbacterium sp.]